MWALFSFNINNNIITFKITTIFIFSFSNCFPSMQLQSMLNTGKHSQTPKGPFSKRFSVLWNKTFDGKSWYPLLWTKWYQKLRYTKRAPSRSFHCTQKVLTYFFDIPSYGSANLCTQAGSIETSRYTRNFHKHQKNSALLIFRYCGSVRQKLHSDPSYGLPKVSRQKNQKSRLWRVLSCC